MTIYGNYNLHTIKIITISNFVVLKLLCKQKYFFDNSTRLYRHTTPSFLMKLIDSNKMVQIWTCNNQEVTDVYFHCYGNEKALWGRDI